MTGQHSRVAAGHGAGPEFTRRRALTVLGLSALAAGSGVFGAGSAWALPPEPVSTARWIASRGSRYFIAHRGSGDVLPEHSMVAYQAAFDWGAPCMEISVGMTADGVLICLHDLSYDRTTTATGLVNAQSSTVLQTARIWQPRLGAAWTENPPAIPLFEDVLQTFGGRVVLAVEAKLDAAYPPMMAMVEKYGLRDSVIVKSYYTSARWPAAKAAGYPVFVYFGGVADFAGSAINRIAERLDPLRDALVLPGYTAGVYLPADVIVQAVAAGVPVWVYPLHRRVDVDHYFALGVQGAICSSYGYLAGAVAAVPNDSWAGQAVASGELSRNPSVDAYAAHFGPANEVLLDARGMQHFLALGQLGYLPAPAERQSITVEACWQALPANRTDNLTIALCRPDDSYYEHRLGQGNGYHAILRANGSLGLYRHRDGQVDGEPLAEQVPGPPPLAGQWVPLRVEITPAAITVTRQDTGATAMTPDTALRGGYLHIGRSSTDGAAAFRSLLVG